MGMIIFLGSYKISVVCDTKLLQIKGSWRKLKNQ